MKIKQKGNIIVVSAPSGAGKTSICDSIIKADKKIAYSISVTTRLPRKGEKNGVEYIFSTEKKFLKMVKENKFIEWAKVHGHYYGTLKKSLSDMLRQGKDVLLDIDVQGGVNIKKLYKDASMIFVMPPSIKVLETRLRSRNKDSDVVIKQRLVNAKKEIARSGKYDYIVVNDKLEEAIFAVRSIIVAQRYKNKKM